MSARSRAQARSSLGRGLAVLTVAALMALPVSALADADVGTAPAAPVTAGPAPSAATADEVPPVPRRGLEIYRQFQQGRADQECSSDVSPRWSKHFAAAPKRLATPSDDTLLLFGYVLDAVRAAHLPSEYALIPFVESGYRPDARSPSGPVGMWQMIERTARNHKVPIRNGYDGRLSPVDSTRAAVRYLKTLHGMFAGNWRLAAMAYNAGEYRILGALKSGGQQARSADPAKLAGVPATTQAYVRKLQALSCVLGDARQQESWVRAMDRPAPRLQAVTLDRQTRRITDWADRHGQDPARVGRLNPVFGGGQIGAGGDAPLRLLAPELGIN